MMQVIQLRRAAETEVTASSEGKCAITTSLFITTATVASSTPSIQHPTLIRYGRVDRSTINVATGWDLM